MHCISRMLPYELNCFVFLQQQNLGDDLAGEMLNLPAIRLKVVIMVFLFIICCCFHCVRGFGFDRCFCYAILTIGTASANSVESDLGCTSRIYFDNVTLTLHNATLT